MAVKKLRAQALPSIAWLIGALFVFFGLVAIVETSYLSGCLMSMGGSLLLPIVQYKIISYTHKVRVNNLIFIGSILIFCAVMGLLSTKDINHSFDSSYKPVISEPSILKG